MPTGGRWGLEWSSSTRPAGRFEAPWTRHPGYAAAWFPILPDGGIDSPFRMDVFGKLEAELQGLSLNPSGLSLLIWNMPTGSALKTPYAVVLGTTQGGRC